MIPGERIWDTELVYDLFDACEAEEIILIPLNFVGGEDVMIWKASPNGIYTVKSAYHLACNMTINESFEIPGRWKDIWRVNVAEKIKIFLWGAARGILPTKDNLAHRGVQLEGRCHTCNNGRKNEWHVFVVCPYAVECWEEMGLGEWHKEGLLRCESFQEFFLRGLLSSDDESRALFGTVLWSLWSDRNSKAWNDKIRSPLHLKAFVVSHRSEWKKVTGREEGGRASGGSRLPVEAGIIWPRAGMLVMLTQPSFRIQVVREWAAFCGTRWVIL